MLTTLYKASCGLVLCAMAFIAHANDGKYAMAGIKKDVEMDAFFLLIQQKVKANDKVALSQMLRYPITTYLNGKPIKIDNPERFVRDYDKIFTGDFKTALLCQTVAQLSVSFKGVSTARGALWMNLAYQGNTLTYDNKVHSDYTDRALWQLKITAISVTKITTDIAKKCLASAQDTSTQ